MLGVGSGIVATTSPITRYENCSRLRVFDRAERAKRACQARGKVHLGRISACLTQRLSDSSAIPSSLATCGKDFSEEWKSRTASSRNSGGYGAPLIGMWIASLWISIPHLQLSTKPTQFQECHLLVLAERVDRAVLQGRQEPLRVGAGAGRLSRAPFALADGAEHRPLVAFADGIA
jgi:hypothetical protein